MKKTTTHFQVFLTLIFVLFCAKLSASQIKGSDFSWKCIGNQRYELELRLYRNCDADSFLSKENMSISCQGSTDSVLNIELDLLSIKKVNLACTPKVDNCGTIRNTPFAGSGIEEFIYTQVIDFGSGILKNMKDNGCCIFNFNFSKCFRTEDISTITPNSNFSTDAQINFCNLAISNKPSCDNSPQLYSLPTKYICCNKPFYFNNGMVDTDGDSLSFEIVAPESNLGVSVNYVSPFTYNTFPMTINCSDSLNCVCDNSVKPPNGFCFDTQTGDFTFTPIKCDEQGIFTVKTKQYRLSVSQTEWLYIGFTKREIHLSTTFCDDNNPPIISPIGNGNDNVTVCEGEEICFTIVAKDVEYSDSIFHQHHKDTISLTWNMGLPGAIFKVGDPYFTFTNGVTFAVREVEICWKPKIGDGRDAPYKFTITARDKACPRNAVTSRNFEVFVKETSATQVFLIEKNFGLWQFESVPMLMNMNKTYHYHWKVTDSTKIGLPLVYSTNQTEVYKFTQDGKYYVFHTFVTSPDGCIVEYFDSIQVDTRSFNPDLSLTQISDNEVFAYPNPFENLIIVSNEFTSNTSFRFLNVTGAVVLQGAVPSDGLIDVSKLTKGIYFIELVNENGSYYSKMIK